MIKTKKSKNKRIGLILCSLFICLCSILCIVPFNQEQKHVSADSVVVESPIFESTSFIINTAKYVRSYNSTGTSVISISNGNSSYSTPSDFKYLNTKFQVSFRYNQSTGNVEFLPRFDFFEVLNSNGATSTGGYVQFASYFGLNLLTDNFSDYQYSLNGSLGDYWLDLNTWSDLTFENGSRRVLVTTSHSDLTDTSSGNSMTTQLTGLQVRIVRSQNSISIANIHRMTIAMNNTYYSSGLSTFVVTYYDTNSNFVSFYFYCGEWHVNSATLPTREYYFTDLGILTDNEYYNQGYQQGLTTGENNGFTNGFNQGRDEGYQLGKIEGKNQGYQEGLEDANQYTFLNLLSATIDAPVKYFQSLFNFELLGVNLQGFLTGLFTLCVIVTIVKLCLGG